MAENNKFDVVGTNIAEKATMIWNVADMLRGPFKPHEYGLVILPMTVVKRFHDCLLSSHKAVLEQYEKGQGLDPYIRFQITQLVEDCRRDRDVVNQYPAEDILRRNNIKKKIDQSETGRELADQIMELLEEETGKISQDNRMVHVEKAIRYIEENYMRDISLEETAQKICITSVYLSRLFKNLLHINFIELLTDVRISHAIRLIQNSDDTIREIGEKVGYQSQTYFYKVFKKNTGMTVGEVKAIFSSSGKMEDR